MKKCVLILGCHRSGTSMLAGLIHCLGIYMGNNLKPASGKNKSGFFEQIDILHTNEKIMKKYNYNWLSENIPVIRDESGEADIKKIIKEQFGDSDIFAVKDPKISRLLPMWISILKSEDIEPVFIAIKRDSEKVCKSMYKFRKINKQKSMRIQKRYMDDINKYANNVMWFNYEDILANPNKEVKKICNILNINFKDVSSFIRL